MGPFWDPDGEAATLAGMAAVHRALGQPQRALQLLEQALPLTQAVGNRTGEAATLNNMARVYYALGQPQRALQFYEQALLLMREVSNRSSEVLTLGNIGYLQMEMGRSSEARSTFEQSIALARQVSHPAGEIAGLIGAATLLYEHLDHAADAVAYLDHALAIFAQTELPQDMAGHTPDEVRQMRDAVLNGQDLSGPQRGTAIPDDQIQIIITNTVAVMTTVREKYGEWRDIIRKSLVDAQTGGAARQLEVDFFTAVLATLDGQAPALPDDHPYAAAIAEIQGGIVAGGP